jgi:CubicO group peptidase (beta-lactamase class C family)
VKLLVFEQILVAFAFLALGVWQLVRGHRVGDPGGRTPRHYLLSPRVAGGLAIAIGLGGLALLRPWPVRLDPPATPPADAREVAVRAEIDPLLRSGHFVGLAVGVLDSTGTHVFGYGRARLDRPGAPDGATAFEIGSITKVYTATLLSKLAIEGAVRLDEPLGPLLPEAIALPESVRAITLEQVATHRSGLPRNPPNLGLSFEDVVPPISNPWGRYRAGDLEEGAPRTRLRAAPGSRFEYSNYGYGLLGVALGHLAGEHFSALLETRVCAPLGLSRTSARTLDPAHRPHDAHGYVVAGLDLIPWGLAVRAHAWTNSALPAAGSLTSTIDDQLRFLAAQLPGVRDSAGAAALAAAIDSTHRPRANGRGTSRVALGWMVREPAAGTDAPVVLWHNGGTGGFRSYVGLVPSRSIGVVVMANSTEDVTSAGMRIALRLAGHTPAD